MLCTVQLTGDRGLHDSDATSFVCLDILGNQSCVDPSSGFGSECLWQGEVELVKRTSSNTHILFIFKRVVPKGVTTRLV